MYIYSPILELFSIVGLINFRNLSLGPVSSTPLYRFIKPNVELGAPGPRKGAVNIVHACVSPELKPDKDNGAYLVPIGKLSTPSKAGSDAKMAVDLWEWTANALTSRGYGIK